ncbi:MAG: putative HTH-type transcriptional regulator YttP [Actinobacteria bacterium ADurb.Bin346]|nr:MAG: putative HTH-type transcriptional regulator YttP [Actinobacteria bacterium ADurb.Bin346]
MNNNNASRADAKDRIIKAVLDLISQKGNISITVREISKKADVNLASINYHFRSIKNLFEEVENFLSEKIFALNQILENKEMDPKKSILSWARALMNFIYDNPGILWLMGNKLINKGSADIFMRKFSEIKGIPVSGLIKEVTGITNKQILNLKAVQILSGIIGPLILYYGVGKEFDFDLNDKKVRDSYSESLVKSILEI